MVSAASTEPQQASSLSQGWSCPYFPKIPRSHLCSGLEAVKANTRASSPQTCPNTRHTRFQPFRNLEAMRLGGCELAVLKTQNTRLKATWTWGRASVHLKDKEMESKVQFLAQPSHPNSRGLLISFHLSPHTGWVYSPLPAGSMAVLLGAMFPCPCSNLSPPPTCGHRRTG